MPSDLTSSSSGRVFCKLLGYYTTTAQPAEGSSIRPITEIGYVTADNLFMREQPGYGARATYFLPRETRVELLGESHHGLDGSVWLRARIDMAEGINVGWVSRRYIE
jgi:Bacterial SH3 domain